MKIRILNADDTPDSEGETFDLSGITFAEEIPVRTAYNPGFEQLIGTAKLTKIISDAEFPSGIDAEITTYNYAGEEVFGSPAVVGRLDARDGKRLLKVHITEIAIYHVRNSDKRILPMKFEKGK